MTRGKLLNAAAVLQRHRANHPEALGHEAVRDLEERAETVERCGSLEVLRGVEGSAAGRYFRSLGTLVPPGLSFDGRNRRPPRDPVNALLSFGYVLVGSELQSLLDGIGFDPYIGFYHRLDYGRPSLALDLLEEFRPALVDRFTVGLLNLGVLGLDDFQRSPEGGLFLSQDGKRRYFAAYEKELNAPLAIDGEALSYRKLFRRQAERLARTLTAGEIYRSFRLPC